MSLTPETAALVSAAIHTPYWQVLAIARPNGEPIHPPILIFETNDLLEAAKYARHLQLIATILPRC